MSHRGVLFLDALPEFNHTALESLRQPLEDKVVTISRVSGSVTYPACQWRRNVGPLGRSKTVPPGV